MHLTPKWKTHPLTLAGHVELVPTDWLFQYRGTDVTPGVDLLDGTIVDMETLWKNIQQDGLYDPVIIRLGRENKKFRLESGNHRIQVFMKYKVAYTPATVQVQDNCGPDVENVMTDATHNFDFSEDVIPKTFKIGYIKPSVIFKSLKGKVQSF